MAMTFGTEKLEWCGYPMMKKKLKIRLYVSTEYTNGTDGQTDGHHTTAQAALAQHRAEKNSSSALTCTVKSVSAESSHTGALVATQDVIAGGILAAVSVVHSTFVDVYNS